MKDILSKPGYRIGWLGVLATLLVICLASPGLAELFPYFDMKNQNGMSSYYYPLGDIVNFTYVAQDPAESILAYNWNLSNSDYPGIVCSNTTIPNYVSEPLENTGIYTMNLTLISANYPWTAKSFVQQFTVTDYSEYIRPNFSYSVDYEGNVPNITLFDLSEAQKLALITEWYWVFNGSLVGDSSSSIVSLPVSPGIYPVSLTVRDKAGDIGSISKTVTILAPPEPTAPVAGFIAVPQVGPAPLYVSFIDQSKSSLDVVSTVWNFGDGTNVTNVASPQHKYSNAGTYAVTQRITYTGGITKEATSSVTVEPVSNVLKANFTELDAVNGVVTGDAPYMAEFVDLSTGSPSAWYWTFGDGSTSAVRSPIHTYLRPGSYTVTLNVFNATKAVSAIEKRDFIKIEKYCVECN